MILNDSAGRGRERDEGEGGTRRKMERGGRMEEESEKIKSCKHCIIGLAGPC